MDLCSEIGFNCNGYQGHGTCWPMSFLLGCFLWVVWHLLTEPWRLFLKNND